VCRAVVCSSFSLFLSSCVLSNPRRCSCCDEGPCSADQAVPLAAATGLGRADPPALCTVSFGVLHFRSVGVRLQERVQTRGSGLAGDLQPAPALGSLPSIRSSTASACSVLTGAAVALLVRSAGEQLALCWPLVAFSLTVPLSLLLWKSR
jgi:hypothetical protein